MGHNKVIPGLAHFASHCIKGGHCWTHNIYSMVSILSIPVK